MSKRKIPSTMATQHPDNASAPFWHGGAFINSQDEIREIYESFAGLGVDEYMWDWEGKFADEATFERLFTKHYDFFTGKKKIPASAGMTVDGKVIGKDVFITLRIPNIWEEKTFKLPRAYMSILSAADFARSIKLHSPPVFEVILPMTKEAFQLMHIQKTFRRTAELYGEIFGEKAELIRGNHLQIIPLFESTEDLAGCGELLDEYVELHVKEFGAPPEYLRVFIARSDPALNAGFAPSILAARMAIQQIYRFGERHKIKVYPILGSGSLPFRGAVNPENLKNVLAQYEGVRTFTVQSGFRYDYDLPVVQKAIKILNKDLLDAEKKGKKLAASFNKVEFETLKKINQIFEKEYRVTIEKAAEFVNEFSAHIPRRRERVQHVGLFGYNRGVGKTKLPRAISFTAVWYSVGVPPEFIGTGRALAILKKKGLLDLVLKEAFTLKSELEFAGRYLNMENLQILAEKHSWAAEILEDVKKAEEILGINFAANAKKLSVKYKVHRNLTSNILLKSLGAGVKGNLKFDEELLEAAKLRRSLG